VNGSAILDALGLPSGARVDRRVPKSILAEHGAPTAADRRHIATGIEELRWVAALKPNTIGVPSYEDAVHQYQEIAVLTLALRPDARASRLTELVHRAVPYPVLLVTVQQPIVTLSLAHKRWSQGEAGKMVLEDKVVEVELRDEPADQAFLLAMSLARQPRSSLHALYQGWIDCANALLAARITGAFARPASAECATAVRKAVEAHRHLQSEIAVLRAKAAKEPQIARRVELNLLIKQLELDLAAARDELNRSNAQ